jgi:hypothetical protein
VKEQHVIRRKGMSAQHSFAGRQTRGFKASQVELSIAAKNRTDAKRSGVKWSNVVLGKVRYGARLDGKRP